MHKQQQRCGIVLAGGFTLVEVLLAMTVLVMLIVFVAHIVNGTTVITTASSKHMDTDSEARLVFERMSLDFAGMFKRADLSYIFSKNKISENQTGNDSMYFFSETPAYFNGSNSTQRSSVALVGYRLWDDPVNDPNDHYYRFQRFSRGLDWNGTTSDNTAGNN